MIKFTDVSKIYGKKEALTYALDKVSFEINKNEVVIILGPSGAGKSTILNLIGGLDYPTGGTVIVDGEEVNKLNNRNLCDYRAKKIGFVFQFYNLLNSLTVYENVCLIKEINKNSLNPDSLLKQLGLFELGNKFPTELSGGEQQRVSIARSLMKNPPILLCDEPTGALDSKTGLTVLNTLLSYKNQDKAIIIVTHNASLAAIADKVIKVKNGHITDIILNEHPIDVNELEW